MKILSILINMNNKNNSHYIVKIIITLVNNKIIIMYVQKIDKH